MKRIYLSPPHLGTRELYHVRQAFESNWIAPVGPHLEKLEAEVARTVAAPHAVALSSGTASLHLALALTGLQTGDDVLCSTLTFIASANPIVYHGGTPVFIDADRKSWNMDPDLLEEELEAGAKRGRLPKAVVVVDLYGQAAEYDRIVPVCERYDVPLIEDAAEALGASYRGGPVGALGKLGILSFNGNKIITGSGGGMLLTHDPKIADRARFLATQARDPAPHYQHSEMGYNYRMSNVIAGIVRGQLESLEQRVAARRANFERYRAALEHLPGIDFMPEMPTGRSTRWLTCITVDPKRFGASREDIRLALERDNIESRPVWKPMHSQPVFSGCRVRNGSVAEDLFERGLCLPSGSALEPGDQDRVVGILGKTCRA